MRVGDVADLPHQICQRLISSIPEIQGPLRSLWLPPGFPVLKSRLMRCRGWPAALDRDHGRVFGCAAETKPQGGALFCVVSGWPSGKVDSASSNQPWGSKWLMFSTAGHLGVSCETKDLCCWVCRCSAGGPSLQRSFPGPLWRTVWGESVQS